MSLFRYTTTMDKEVYEIEADYYEVQQQETKNLQDETSIVIMYVFYKNGKVKYEIPALHMEKIREVE